MPALEAVSDTFTREDALRHLREHVFRSSPDDRRVGIEAELIPVWAESGERVPIVNPDARGMVDLLRAHGRDRDWQEAVSPYGSPRFTVPGGGWISFEPGGQIEWSSAPLTSVAAVAEQACRVIPPLVSSVAAAGVRLVGRGIDPFNPLARCPLLLTSARYARMARYLEAWHPHGARMMRQTAAMHVNLDFGPDPERRFRAAQALVPLLVAVFANSSRHEGRETGHRSYRAHQWRHFDPARSGIIAGPDGPQALLERAEAAPDFLAGEPAPFGDRLRRGGVSADDWEQHLSTFFTEVRPRGYIEVRSIDALQPRWYAAPLVFLTGLLYDEAACEWVLSEAGTATHERLVRAGRSGVEDPGLHRLAMEAWRQAMWGAERLGEEYIGPAALGTTKEFLDRFTARGRDPGHEPDLS